eukprot:TRINITY_DN4997_c0_g2_i1.p1 TRINITY_DN4997_c0_g2~~TRINITY_DN4997_c0_g2_i1.p1  ORF type:complete len:189 (-),score=11.93 TRINITY_DN4997_c0_g2_i1:47-613(-)
MTRVIVLPEKEISTIPFYKSKADQIAAKLARNAVRFGTIGQAPASQQVCTLYSYLMTIMLIHFPKKMSSAIIEAKALDGLMKWSTETKLPTSFTLFAALTKDCGHLMHQSTVESFVSGRCLPSLTNLATIQFVAKDQPDVHNCSMAAYAVFVSFEKFPSIITTQVWDQLATCIGSARCESVEFAGPFL